MSSFLPTLLAAAEMAEEAEKSELPFYIAGGALAMWAVIVSAIGLSRPDFPRGDGPTRIVMAISVVLVLAVTTSTVLVS